MERSIKFTKSIIVSIFEPDPNDDLVGPLNTMLMYDKLVQIRDYVEVTLISNKRKIEGYVVDFNINGKDVTSIILEDYGYNLLVETSNIYNITVMSDDDE